MNQHDKERISTMLAAERLMVEMGLDDQDIDRLHLEVIERVQAGQRPVPRMITPESGRPFWTFL